MDNPVRLSTTDVKVAGSYDVIILGGGTSGAFAGISAARCGMKTLIIEQFGALGGSATMGLVTPLMSSHMPDYRGHSPIGAELSKRMQAVGGCGEDDYQFDPTMLKFVLEEMVVESGCSLLYYSTPVEAVREGSRITHVILHNKDGFSAYAASCFVDCTGDADFAVMSGVPFESGDHNRVNQPVSLRFEMAGIHFDDFHAYMRRLGNNSVKYFAMNTPGMKELLRQACTDGLLTEQDIVYFQAFGVPGKPDAMNFNCPELTTKENVVDTQFMTQKQIEGKQAILRLKRFLNERVPGFESAYITEVSSFVGFRESRRIAAEYVMTIQDILAYRKFEDAITACRYPVDVHGLDDVTLGLKYDDTVPKEKQYWEVPFRCMIATGIDNLLVSGRCAGFDFRAQSAARIQLICRAMGEAAGIGCAMACKAGIPFREVDGSAVGKITR